MTTRYHIVAIWLHWIIALLIIINLASGLMMGSGWVKSFSLEDKINYYQWHKTVGVIVLLLSLFRIYWRIRHETPLLPDSMLEYEKILAKLGHYLLYFFMLALPLTGWLMVSASTLGIPTMLFTVIEWPHVPIPSGIDHGKMAKNMSEIHEILAYILLILLGIHVAAALRHHFLLRDDILTRMLPLVKSAAKK